MSGILDRFVKPIRKGASDIAKDIAEAASIASRLVRPVCKLDNTLLAIDRKIAGMYRTGRWMLGRYAQNDVTEAFSKAMKRLDEVFKAPRSEYFVELKKGADRDEALYLAKRKLPAERHYALKSLPYIIIKTDAKHCKEALQLKPSKFGLEKIVTGTIASAGRYTPELITHYAGIRPRSGRHRKTRPRIRAQSGLWNLNNIGAYDAMEISTGQGATIAIIDTGIDYTHPDLEARFGADKGYNFVSDNDKPMDDNEHGTHCAGIAAGIKTGIARESRLYALKVLDENGAGTLGDIVRALDWCIAALPDVASMSLGSGEGHPLEEKAIWAAYSAGINLVAAAGNCYFGPSFPASYDGVISVAAVDRDNEHAEFSNIWMTNDISAPGVGIYSTVPGGYNTFSGTSMATPHVSGSIALAASLSKISSNELEALLKDTCEPLGDKDVYGAGLLRADNLVARASMGSFKDLLRFRRRR